MDELDELESLDKVDDSGDIKNKILFSVLVVSTIIFICICSCESFKKVVIIYLKWVKRPMRTPEESAWGNFFRKKATFCEHERLVGQMIIDRPRDIWERVATVTTWPLLRRSWMRSPGESTSRSPPSSLAASVSMRFWGSFHVSQGQNRKYRSSSSPGLSLLRNHAKRLATQAIAHQISTLSKRSRNSECGVSRSLAFAVNKS